MKRKFLLLAIISMATTLTAFSQDQEVKVTASDSPVVEYGNEEEEKPEVKADGMNENGEIEDYRRSSLFSFLIKHSSFNYGETIDSVFMSIPTDDKFNDHNLDIRSLESTAVKQKKRGNKKDETNMADIQKFFDEHKIAREIVAKWFDRNKQTGVFSMRTIQERGFYDASQASINVAENSDYGKALLGDAGEELIGKTFIIANDIVFVDRGERSAKVGGFLKVLGAVAAAATGESAMADLGNTAGALASEVDGFNVNIHSYLFRLNWNDSIAYSFYDQCWVDSTSTLDPERVAAFDKSELFTISYVGDCETSAANLASKSFAKKSKREQMQKVCTRAIDKSIVGLQREFDEFKVNVPIMSINEDEKTVDVAIGLKEGINKKSTFEVLMPVEGEDGKIEKYKTIGKIKPVADQIWDNRFGAMDDVEALIADGKLKAGDTDVQLDGDDGAKGNPFLKATTFKVVSGMSNIYPGCMVREESIKRD